MAIIQSGLSLNFYIFIIVIIVGLLFVAYSIRRMKYSWRQIWRSVWVSFLTALMLALIFAFVISLIARPVYAKTVDCVNPPCAYGADNSIFFWVFLFSLPVFFFIVWIVYYVAALIRNKNRKVIFK
ncbi:MAG: hypothetical protein KKD18_06820 [Nanoarchaeota archaeon]|nr:hypothetical protein [Nanoarchaeota archaeon]MBU0978104.1 hypothetical protein [Nanoarchaeota archaeon]